PGLSTQQQASSSSKDKDSGKGGGGSSLQEVKRRGRMERSREEQEEELSGRLHSLVRNNNTTYAKLVVCTLTAVFLSRLNVVVFSHPECAGRVTSIMEELESQELLSCCVRVEPRDATEEELLLAHTKQHVDTIRATQTMTQSELQTLSETFDSVYLHPETFSVCVSAVGSVLQLVDRVMTSELRNGFAIIRPPGHHAQPNECNGFCVFNNVAIAARYAQTRHAARRVLIVDWDVHHGQGIQGLFQDDPNVLYFSVHRYERGSFWPHLPESDSVAVGSGRAEGRNINLPWNQTGMKDGDYITAFLKLLLPVACEFQPQLVLVSAGFDAAAGDPKGEMCVSPQGFHVLTHMLMSLAEGRLVLALEGGYNLQATAEGAAACVRALLGGPCPPLTSPTAPCDSRRKLNMTQVHPDDGGSLSDVVTGFRHHPEQPQRIFKIFSKHQQLGLVDRCRRIPARLASEEELLMCHSVQHLEQMKATSTMKPRDLHKLSDKFNSIYINNQSFHCARLAAGSCFSAVEQILSGQVSNGVAIVRPPGHHAERDAACGFCFFNTAALAARFAQKISHEPQLRVLIVDWDVHHGNGTQHIFEEDSSVLYVSLHRYDNGVFFPSSEDAAPDRVGVAAGAGFNVNVAFSGGRMGDSDYLAAFHHVVMPIAAEFNPGLVLVSAGFDAARGDPLGGYQVTPEGYAHLTHMLMALAGGRVLLILEGGYNLTSISDSMAMCTRTLLGDPPPSLVTPLPPPHRNATLTINEVIRHHAPYWKSLRIHIPESVKAALPPPKHRGKRGSQGKGRKSDQIGNDKPLLPPSGPEDSTQSLDQLTQGLAGLDISQLSASDVPVTSTPVGGARPKIRLGPEVKVESGYITSELSQSDESTLPQVKECFHKRLSICSQSTLYVVDPLPWCPHLDAVKPLPPSGIDVFLPCQDCGADTENWTCLTCYQVFCGRYVNEHMVTHGVVSEHPVVLSFADLSVWCYLCEAYVHNQILFEAKNAAHCAKFGEEIPPWS
uniref:Protein deacetylase HDAC6 n=1 Tax=Salarias fasciatus TaxID=181472 RepID=A0A672IMB2_SALFA